MALFGLSSGDEKSTAADLPPHKDINQVVPLPPKTGVHGGARPGAGRKPGTPPEKRAVETVPAKDKFKCTPEIARPLAALPFVAAATLLGSDTLLLEEDEEEEHAVGLSAAANDLGLEIAHAVVYAYLGLLTSTVMVKIRAYRKEKKHAPPVLAAPPPAAIAEREPHAQPAA